MGELRLKLLNRVSEISQADWNELALADPLASPFLRWEFLHLLEETGCVSGDRGWLPRHFSLWEGECLIAVAPAYLKVDGMGDFSRDWAMANFAQQVQFPMYPKLVFAVPFSPITGRRVLVRADRERQRVVRALAQASIDVAKQLEVATVQVLFCQDDSLDDWVTVGFARRKLLQYHWKNQNYSTFDDWLGSFRSKKRNQIRREVRVVEENGFKLQTLRGSELLDADLPEQAFRLYAANVDRFMWGHRYLTKEFFLRAFQELPDVFEFVTAHKEERLVGGAVNVASGTHLYGRYWGCFEEHQFLHFNVCLYHSVSECIRLGRSVFEGGMGGEHKLARGFEPCFVYSAHWYAHPQFQEAVEGYLTEEQKVLTHERDVWFEANGRS